MHVDVNTLSPSPALARVLVEDRPVLALWLDGRFRDLSAASDERLTLLIIAHRMATIEHCDHLLLLEAGRLVAEGSFAELRERHRLFRELAQDVAVA